MKLPPGLQAAAIPLELLAIAAGLILITAIGWSRRMRNWTQQRSRLRAWRKKRGHRQSARTAGEPATPFHVRTKLGDPGDPRTGISTADTDNLFAAQREAKK